MTRDWEFGDVALVENVHGVWNVAIMAVLTDALPGWRFGVADSWVGLHANARPLVVIDPENREQVEAFAAAYRDVKGEAEFTDEPWSVPGLRMQAALREFANPKPPKPEEPQGLGAVVEDSAGLRWLRAFGSAGFHVWHSERVDTAPQQWHAINVVRVLSEGVTP